MSSPPAAFPSLRPPSTPLLDQMLAVEKAKEAPPLEHVWHTERLLNTGTMRKELVTWCLRCSDKKAVRETFEDDNFGPAEEVDVPACRGEMDPRVAAPWLGRPHD